MLAPLERRVLMAVAETVVPPGKFFDGGGEEDVRKIEALLDAHPFLSGIYRNALRILEFSAVLHAPHRRFSRLGVEDRERIFSRWRTGRFVRRAVADLLCETIKTAHFSDPGVYAKIGCVWDKSPKAVEPERFLGQMRSASDIPGGGVIDCDVVVVGTGSGGAVVAKELSEKGLAVLIVEEGRYWNRKDFTGRLLDAAKFYRDSALTFAMGNTLIPVLMGKMVGGSTAVNTGTCWKTPEWILRHWVEDLGLSEFAPEKLDPFFRRVEEIIQVAPAKEKVVGGIAKVIARGCDRMGLNHYPVRRNAPDCDGQGVCLYGCPTDARRSTNVSYIPLALKIGAELIVEAKARRVLIEGGHAVGLELEGVEKGNKVTVRSRAVVLACGAVMTPALLLEQGIANSSGWVGRNLTLHPAATVCALFEDDEISSYRFAPQGYCVDTFHKQGILLLGAGLSIDAGAATIPLIGRKFSEVMSNFDNLASFAVMVEDRPSGRILMAGGKPRIFYWLGKRERALLTRGIELLAEIYFNAGAKEVYPMLRGLDVLASRRELARLRVRDFAAADYRLASFHPLGTCRMGKDPRRSVVDASHQTHDIPGLYICDGSVVPTSIAVNPQETIMAMSTRAAERILEALG